jgi:hypothetical protein
MLDRWTAPSGLDDGSDDTKLRMEMFESTMGFIQFAISMEASTYVILFLLLISLFWNSISFATFSLTMHVQ